VILTAVDVRGRLNNDLVRYSTFTVVVANLAPRDQFAERSGTS
jgi:hypothetical protein